MWKSSSFDLADPATYVPLQITSRAVNFGPIAAGGTAVRFINLSLDGPFALVVEVDPLDGEPNFPNNVLFEIFPPGISISPGSPYPATSASFTVVNSNPLDHIAIPLIHGLPPAWKATVKPEAAPLMKGKEMEFNITFEPPDPSIAKPGTFEKIDVVTWIDTEHSLLPLNTFPAYVSLTFQTKLVVGVDVPGPDVAAVRATFTHIDLAGKELPVPGQRLALAVTGDDGSEKVLYGTTNSNGQVQFKVDVVSGVRQAVVAQFLGSSTYRSAVSEALFLVQEQPKRPAIKTLVPRKSKPRASL